MTGCLSIRGVAINLRNSVQKEEDAIGRHLGLGVVGGKGSGLTCSSSAKDEGRETHKDTIEGEVCHVAVWEGDLPRPKPEHNGVHEVEDALGEGIGQPVEEGVEQSLPVREGDEELQG